MAALGAMQLVVMGASGAGKSAVGARLAAALGVPFGEGDALHPPANVARMAAGQPLSDADRAPWLEAVAAWFTTHPAGVVACSALKRRYRDRLRLAAPNACFLLLEAPTAVLRARLEHRPNHFMPATLLDSQLAALEPLGADERGWTVDATGDVPATIVAIVGRLAST